MATYRNSDQTIRVPYGRTLCVYEAHTPDIVVGWLERCLKDRFNGITRLVRVFYGDTDYPGFKEIHKRLPDPGMDWMEENDVIGHIGRSIGDQHIPLIITEPKGIGGPSIMDGCIVRMKVDGKEIYRHPNYCNPLDAATIEDCQIENLCAEVVLSNGSVPARFKTRALASAWISFMRGETDTNPDIS